MKGVGTMKIDWKDVGVRAAKTFVQAACAATVTLLGSGQEGGEVFTMTAIISILAAGVSAVWNAVISPILEKLSSNSNG